MLCFQITQITLKVNNHCLKKNLTIYEIYIFVEFHIPIYLAVYLYTHIPVHTN